MIVELEGLGEAHVVPGKIGAIAGREWLKKHHSVLDFRTNQSSIDGVVSSPAHLVNPSQFSGHESQSDHCATVLASGKTFAPGQVQGCQVVHNQQVLLESGR